MSVPPAVARLVARATRPPVTVDSPLAAHLDDAGTALPAVAVPPAPHPSRAAPPVPHPSRAAPPIESPNDYYPVEPPNDHHPAETPSPARPAVPRPGTPALTPPLSSPARRSPPAVPVGVPTPGATAWTASDPVGEPPTAPVPVVDSTVADVEGIPAASPTGAPARPVVAGWPNQPEGTAASVPPGARPAALIRTPDVAAAPTDPTAPTPIPAAPRPGTPASDRATPPDGAPAPRETAKPAPVPPVQIGRIEIQVAPPPAEIDPFSGCRALEGGVTARRGGGW